MKWLAKLWATISGSFYNPAEYAEVERRGLSSGLWYAVICGVLSALFVAAAAIPGLMEVGKLDISSEAVSSAYPDGLQILIQKGEVKTNMPEPYRLSVHNVFPNASATSTATSTDSEPGYLLTIDTSHPLTLEEVRAYDSFVVLGKSEVYVVKDDNELRTYDLSDVEDLTINEEMAKAFVGVLRPWLYVFLGAFSILLLGFLASGTAAFYLFMALLGALVMLAVASGRSQKISYKQAYILALYAMIPVAIFDILTDLIRVGNSFWLGVLVFTVAALLNVRRSDTPVPENAA